MVGMIGIEHAGDVLVLFGVFPCACKEIIGSHVAVKPSQ